MRFVVRYWSSMLPEAYRRADGSVRLQDYSIHPPTRLGLHNAMLVRNDRVEILEGYGGSFECEVYVVEGEDAYVLTQDQAIRLFRGLPGGEVKWLEIREFLLPLSPPSEELPVSVQGPSEPAALSHELQLHLFEYTHQPWEGAPPHFDADA